MATYTPFGANGFSASTEVVYFDYLVYALGSHLPPPINLWSTVQRSKAQTNGAQQLGASLNELSMPQTKGSKAEGVKWLRDAQEKIRDAESVLVIGAGALGVREWAREGRGGCGRLTPCAAEYASDIAWTYGTAVSEPRWAGHQGVPTPKRVTLLSSSSRILPRFQPWMHEEGVRSLQTLGVDVMTGTRADLSTLGDASSLTRQKVQTLDGRQIEADVVVSARQRSDGQLLKQDATHLRQLFCTGQRPNTDYLQVFGDVLDPKTGMASVNAFMQLRQRHTTAKDSVEPHIFVVGDAADAFGALNAGHTAWDQAGVAARNIAKLIGAQEGRVSAEQSKDVKWLQARLEEYHAEPHRIKVSVGLDRAIRESAGEHSIIESGTEDLNAASLWIRRGLDTSDMTV